MCKSCGYQEWDRRAEHLLDKLEDLPSRADEFAEGIEEKVKSMREWVGKNKHVTDNMENALTNMTAGVRKWLPDDDDWEEDDD